MPDKQNRTFMTKEMWLNPSSNILCYLPTIVKLRSSSYEKEELEAFYMDLERLYREDRTSFEVIVGDFDEIGFRKIAEELLIVTHGME
ncbi:hypothetical protein V3C99_013808 [Haemonchus contortus]